MAALNTSNDRCTSWHQHYLSHSKCRIGVYIKTEETFALSLSLSLTLSLSLALALSVSLSLSLSLSGSFCVSFRFVVVASVSVSLVAIHDLSFLRRVAACATLVQRGFEA